MAAKRQGPAGRQYLPATNMVIDEQSQTCQPGRPAPLQPRNIAKNTAKSGGIIGIAQRPINRQDKAQRPGNMRHHAKQYLTFLKRFTHHSELEIFKIAQPAMKQFGRG